MIRTCTLLLAALGIAGGCLPGEALAADEEIQLWLTGTATVPLAEEVAGTFELSRRIRENDDQILVRGIADLRLSETTSIGGGIAYVDSIDGLLETGSDREFRLQQQLTLSVGMFSFRTRLEQRFFEDADRMQLRIRQRVQAGVSVTHDLHAALSGELFYVARSEVEGGDDQIAQWRLNASIAHKPARTLELTLGYLLMYTPRTGAPDKIAHVPQLTLTYRP